jgi:hypothetical protein
MTIHINRSYKSGWLLLAVAAVFIFQSACKKDDISGAPMVTGLRAISPAPNDSMLSQVVPGQVVVIKGKNFNNLQQVFFDGYPASVNTALNTSSTMIMTVPAGIIFTEVAPEDLNTIKVVTGYGSTVYKFSVVPPPAVISSISNEFAPGGDTITLKGRYLYTIQKVIFPGGKEVSTGIVSNPEGTSMQVVVPANITTGVDDSIAVVTAGGVGKAAFYNTFGTLANFEWGDAHFGWQYWGGINTGDASAFPGNTGNYIEIKPALLPINPGDGSWYADNRAVMVDSSAWTGVNTGDPVTNYALKFEMSVKGVWTTGSLMIAINGNFNYLARYAPWEQAPGGQFTAQHWITVTIPLDKFLKNAGGSYDGSGTPAATVSVLTGGAPGETIQIMLYNDGDTPITAFDAAFDNVRVVKINP